MSTELSHPRRVLLVLDACAARADLLEQAAQLASALGSELSVRYLEDERLLQSASLPFTREIMAVTSSLRAISHDMIRLSYRSETTQIKNRLRVLAQERGISWTFESTHNGLSDGGPGSDGNNDVLLVEEKRYNYLSSMSSSVFISRSSHCQMNHVVVLFDGSPDAQRCLSSAAKLATYYKSALNILVPAVTEEHYNELLGGIGEMHEGGGKVRISRITGFSSAEIGKAVRWKRGGLLVIPSTVQPAQRDMKELMKSLQMQVLVIKGGVAPS